MKTQVSSPAQRKGGFFWWLLWIAVAVGSFLLSAIFWTWLITQGVGEIRGTPLTILWTSAVFGSWLLTMIPIIRAKERYWNRLSQEDETNVTWWIGWMALTLAAFFASAGFWTWFFAKSGGNIKEPGAAARWVFAIFGTWMAALLPLIIVMYQKVDRAYEKAREQREKNENQTPRPKTIYVDPLKRRLPESLVQKLEGIPATIKKGRQAGHLVQVVLRDGRRFENVFVANRSEVLGIYGYDTLPFEGEEIADLEPIKLEKLTSFSEEHWLRLDGRG